MGASGVARNGVSLPRAGVRNRASFSGGLETQRDTINTWGALDCPEKLKYMKMSMSKLQMQDESGCEEATWHVVIHELEEKKGDRRGITPSDLSSDGSH